MIFFLGGPKPILACESAVWIDFGFSDFSAPGINFFFVPLKYSQNRVWKIYTHFSPFFSDFSEEIDDSQINSQKGLR